MVLHGSVRLPAVSEGITGPGACVDAVGGTNCIEMETNAVRCPYQPDHCSMVNLFSSLLKCVFVIQGQIDLKPYNRHMLISLLVVVLVLKQISFSILCLLFTTQMWRVSFET